MTQYSRRAFVGASAAALSATVLPVPLQAATQCVTGILPAFQPTSLSVNCASKRNFRGFRRRPDALALTGVVSMSFVRASQGTYSAGSLFLFPWCKTANKSFPGWVPLNVDQFLLGTPIPDATLPLDEYFLRYVLQAPCTSFIGFQVDVPYSASDAPRDWCSNVDDLGDGKGGVGIDWTSQNLNQSWFAGSNWIPATDTCGGNAWRSVIAAALAQTAVGLC